MKKRQSIELPQSFLALLEYLRGRGYAEASVLEYENHARRIVKFLWENGYDSYTAEAYSAVLQNIQDNVPYESLSEPQKRRYHCATVFFEFQQTGSYTFRRKMAEKAIEGGLKEDIERYMEHRKHLLQSEVTQKQYRRWISWRMRRHRQKARCKTCWSGGKRQNSRMNRWTKRSSPPPTSLTASRSRRTLSPR